MRNYYLYTYCVVAVNPDSASAPYDKPTPNPQPPDRNTSTPKHR